MRSSALSAASAVVVTVAMAGALGTLEALETSLLAQSRTAIVVNDTLVFPESVTSAADGSVFFGSTAKGIVYRAAPGASKAEPWIQKEAGGFQNVLGVFADNRANTLWVCSSPMAAQAGTPPPAGETAVKAFDLRTAAPKGSYAFPGGGLCNDIAVAADGTTYATDTAGGRILRLKPRAAALDVWSSDPLLVSIDGIAVLSDGAVYANTVRTNFLVRLPLRPDGSAGQAVKLETSRPIARPDGMRGIGGMTILLVEGEGRLDEVTIQGDRAEVRLLKDGFTGGPTAVTLVGSDAYVLESKFSYRNDPTLKDKDPGPFQATAVPYQAAR
jgi:streptogramin lyase